MFGENCKRKYGVFGKNCSEKRPIFGKNCIFAYALVTKTRGEESNFAAGRKERIFLFTLC